MTKDDTTVAVLAGIAASVFFWTGFLSYLFARPDAQNGIGVCLSPFFAVWFGASVGLFTFGWRRLRALHRAGQTADDRAITFLAVGFTGVVMLVGWLIADATLHI